MTLKWQTGKPPKDGWYWVEKDMRHAEPTYYNADTDEFYIEPFGYTERIGNTDKWAGPLEPPAEEERDAQ